MENITVKVIYPKGSFDSRYEVDNMLVIPSCGDVKQDLETVFRYMNGVDGSEIEHQLQTFGCRDMSMGDIVEFANGEQYRCEGCGFSKVGEPR